MARSKSAIAPSKSPFFPFSIPRLTRSSSDSSAAEAADDGFAAAVADCPDVSGLEPAAGDGGGGDFSVTS